MNLPRRELTRSTPMSLAGAVVAASLLLSGGCYDSQALTQAKIKQAERMQLEDVDLGKFRITLPKLPGEAVGGVIVFHAFGQVTNQDRKAVEHEIKVDDATIRNRMLMAVRTLAYTDFEDPDLKAFRDKIAVVVNQTLENNPVKGIGFYNLRFSTL